MKVRTGVCVCVTMLPSLRLREMTSHFTHVGCLEHDSSQYYGKQFSLFGHRLLRASSSTTVVNIVQGTRPDTPAIRLRATRWPMLCLSRTLDPGSSLGLGRLEPASLPMEAPSPKTPAIPITSPVSSPSRLALAFPMPIPVGPVPGAISPTCGGLAGKEQGLAYCLL